MHISSDKAEILINSIKPRQSTNIWMKGKVLYEVWSTAKRRKLSRALTIEATDNWRLTI